jgi:hypothetical protein
MVLDFDTASLCWTMLLTKSSYILGGGLGNDTGFRGMILPSNAAGIILRESRVGASRRQNDRLPVLRAHDDIKGIERNWAKPVEKAVSRAGN